MPGPRARAGCAGQDVDDSVGEAAAPAGVVVPAAELPVGQVVAGLDQCVAEGAGVVEQVAFFRAGLQEQPAGVRCAGAGGLTTVTADMHGCLIISLVVRFAP